MHLSNPAYQYNNGICTTLLLHLPVHILVIFTSKVRIISLFPINKVYLGYVFSLEFV